MTERVPGLTLGDGTEEGGDVGLALDVGLLREVEVAPVGLALPREGLLQVVVGLAAFQIRHCCSFVCVSNVQGTVGASAAHSSHRPRKLTSTAETENPRR